jgi:formimidoylglutamate deiminase
MIMAEQTIWCKHGLLPGGWREGVCLQISADGMIQRVGTGHLQDADTVLDGAVVPGMPNLHSHGFQRLMAGLTGVRRDGVDSFWGWRQVMYDFANRLTPPQLADCAAWLYAEMLCAGYTSCAEFHYLHHQPGGQAYGQPAEMSLQVLAAADDAGIGLTLLPVLYQVAGFGKDQVEAQQLRFHNTLQQYLTLLDDCQEAVNRHSLQRLGAAPHSLRAVPRASLAALLEQLPDPDMPVHIHIAEQAAEVEDCLREYGARPLAWLLDHAPVDQRWCLVHATHINSAELERAARSGAIAGLCPTTEADLGDGYFKAREWLAGEGQLGIGSDSNLRVSVSEELRLLEFNERLRSGHRQLLRTPDQPCGRFLYQHAALAGARALGQPVGQLSEGCRADLVELDTRHPLLAARSGDEWLESFVFAGGKDMIRSVFVGGRQRVSEGRHQQAERLRGRYLSALKALRGT